jgi:LacI family gluconate utilization system Gnt-I transcriptional repressor
MSDRLRGAGTPVVEMWDSSEPRLDMAVGFSNYRVGFEIGEHLVACGYRRLGYVSTTDAHEAREKRAAERSRGFYAALREAGLARPARVSVPDPLDIDRCGAIATDFAEAHPELDALMCANEIIGAGAIAELRRRGWEVPEGIAVAGIGDAHIAGLVSPGLTTVRIHGYEIGRHAAEMILARLRDQSVAEPCLEVAFEVVARGSTRSRR